MGVTRGYRADVTLISAMAAGSTLLAEPLLLVGAVGLAAWLLERQYAFVRSVSRIAASLSVSQSPERSQITEHDSVDVSLEASLEETSPLELGIEANPPVGVKTDDSAVVTIPRGGRTVTTTFEIQCHLAGEFEFDPATVTTTDPTDRFSARFSAGTPWTMTVHARGPQDIHVGAGGEAVAMPFGDVDVDERGIGLDFAELRAYVPGDSVRYIDWKATARFDQIYVRNFETKVERRNHLVVDCRGSMATGSTGRTKFDYARQLGLSVVEYARKHNEPIGLYTVGEEGLIDTRPVVAHEEGYAAIEHRLRSLAPNDTHGLDESTRATSSPADARRRSRRLHGDDSAYASLLRPFFNAADPYVDRLEGDPLYGAVRAHLTQVSGPVTTVLITDDSNRGQTRAAVRAARRRNGFVLVFLTPTVLFEESGDDIETVYQRYADFQRFRERLSKEKGITAFEIAPGDRLTELLSDYRDQHAKGMAD